MRIPIANSVTLVALALSSAIFAAPAAPVDLPIALDNTTLRTFYSNSLCYFFFFIFEFLVAVDPNSLLSGIPSLPVGGVFPPQQQQDLLNKLTSAISDAAGDVKSQMHNLPPTPRSWKLSNSKWFSRSPPSSDAQPFEDIWDSGEPPADHYDDDDDDNSTATIDNFVDESGNESPKPDHPEGGDGDHDHEREAGSSSSQGYWGEHGHTRRVAETVDADALPLPAALPVPVDLPVPVPAGLPVPLPNGAAAQPPVAVPTDLPLPASAADGAKDLASSLARFLPIPTSRPV
jgi:hypothetical protein